jgi:hypothetical protein
MARYQLTTQDRKKGGRRTAALPGQRCPHCGQDFPTHTALAGHLGLVAYAARYCAGNLDRARRSLHLIGRAAQSLPGGEPDLERAEAERVLGYARAHRRPKED